MGESHLMWHHFPCVDYLKIESQRLDLKPIYNKTAPVEKETGARRKKKKKNEEEEINPGATLVAQPRSRGLGRVTQAGATWVSQPRLRCLGPSLI